MSEKTPFLGYAMPGAAPGTFKTPKKKPPKKKKAVFLFTLTISVDSRFWRFGEFQRF